ncbi:MAG: hypothetical protein SFY96_00500 [Planctomycetota bacterium]|nr:hypothetical protein [Planctomycetota bacterium]
MNAARGVLLLHELPDGTSHIDWMFEERPGAASLRSFRIACRIDAADCPERFEATPTPNHRTAYLTYEGAVSGGRGTVRRLASADAWVHAADDASIELTCDWGLGPRRWRGQRAAADQWVFAQVRD